MGEFMRADEAAVEDDGGFHDYTIATSLEKLIASIENALRHVLTKDLPRRYENTSATTHMPATYTAHLNHRLPFRSETYSLNLHLPSTSSSPSTIHPSKSTTSFSSLSLESPEHPSIHCSLGDQPNKLQEWFLRGPCLVILPDSYSGRILDEEEAHTLLSAGAAALSHLKLAWPVYIPVHDALRDAFRGIFVHSFSSGRSGGSGGGNASPFSKLNTPMRSPGTGGTANDHTISGAVVRLESDSIHSNRSLPILEFCTLSGQSTMFASRLRWHAPHAASLCSELATVAADCLERGDSRGFYSKKQDEIEDQNLATAAEALALHSTPSPLKTPPQQRRPSGDDSTVLEEEEIDVRWEMRRCYHFIATPTATTMTKDQSSSHLAAAAAKGVAAGGDISINEDNSDDAFELLIDTWDEDAVWRPWAAEDDPIERLEVDALWTFPLTTRTNTNTQSSSSSISSNNVHSNSHIDANLVAAAIEVEQTGGTSSNTPQQQQQPPAPLPSSASTWRLAALRRDYQPDDGRRPLILLQSVDQRRHFLRLQSVTELPFQLQTLTSSVVTGSLSPSLLVKPPTDALPGETSFSGMLTTLLDHVYYIISATDASDLTSDDWWLQQGNYVPPLTPSYIIQDAIRDIFQAVSMPPAWPGTGSGTSTGLLIEQFNTLESFADDKEEDAAMENDKKINSEILVGKGAPSSSLISRLALHALRLGNPRAIAMLWTKFLRELRFAHWEASLPLPRMDKKETSMEAAAAAAVAVAADVSNEYAATTPKEIQDSQYCVLYQKLQLLDMSIRSKLQTHATERKEDQSEPEEDDEGYTSATENSDSTSVNPTLEGEKALHFLETLHPAAVYAELLAVGFTAAVAILQKAPAATLPAVAAQIEKVNQVGNAWLSDHGVAVIGNGTVGATVLSVVEAAATTGEETASITPSASESNLCDTTASDINDTISDQPLPQHQVQLHNHTSLYDSNGTISVSPAVHAMIHSGLGVDGMKTLVQILACVEQTIAAGQSILQRLQSDSLSSTTTNEKFSKKAANALVIKALHHGSNNFNFNSSPTNDTSNEENVSIYGSVIDVDATEFAILADMASNRNSGQGNNTSTPLPRETVASTAWNPTPFWSEWSISMSKGDAVNPFHRLFVRQLPAELRVATVITSEMS